MNKASLALSIIALLGLGFVFKLNTDQGKIITEQSSRIEELYSTVQGMDDRMQALLDLGESFKSDKTNSAKNGKTTKTRYKMNEGYYCLVGSKSDNTVIYIDGVNRMKSWGDADGTLSFKKTEPDTAGRYALTGDEIIMSLNDNVEKFKFTRRGKILGADGEGMVLEFQVLEQLFSYNNCPFKK